MKFIKDFLAFLMLGIGISVALFIATIIVSYIFTESYEVSFQNGVVGFAIAFSTCVGLGFLASILMTFLYVRS